MDVKAILILARRPELEGAAGEEERIRNLPLALCDVLGRPVLHRVIERLQAQDVPAVSVIADCDMGVWPCLPTLKVPGLTWMRAEEEQMWRAAEQAFSDYAQAGADVVLVMRLGPYTELEVEPLLQFHLSSHNHVTAVADTHGVALGIYAVSASRRNEAAYLLRHRLQETRTACTTYRFHGYCNRLINPHDLRQLAVDGLMQRAQIEPVGSQIKPGVWVGPGARIHRRARVLTPAYIGPHARVRAAAVITRCSVLEHHAVVDCGSVIEDVTLLPYTYAGPGLDLMHSLVGFRRLWHLKRAVEVEIADPKLIGMASTHAPVRAVGSLLSLASFVPAQILRGLFAPSQREAPASLPQAVSTPSPALKSPAALKTTASPAVPESSPQI